MSSVKCESLDGERFDTKSGAEEEILRRQESRRIAESERKRKEDETIVEEGSCGKQVTGYAK